MGVLVGVSVGVSVGVFVGVLVGVSVGVSVGVFVGVSVGVSVGVFVGVLVGVSVGVSVGVAVSKLSLALYTASDDRAATDEMEATCSSATIRARMSKISAGRRALDKGVLKGGIENHSSDNRVVRYSYSSAPIASPDL